MAGTTALRDYLVRVVGKAEGMSNVDNALRTVDKSMNNVAQSTKRMARQLALSIVGFQSLAQVVMKTGRKIHTMIKNSIDLADNLEETAKKLGMTTEKARAHQIALEVMGKTLNEINNDATLKKTYDELVKLGESLALPDAAKGVSAIKDIKKAFTNLRVTLRYGIQWVYYYLQQYLKTPLERLKKAIFGADADMQERIKKIANTIANVLANVYLIGERLVKDLKHIWDWLKKIFNSLGGEDKARLMAVIGLLTLLLNKGLAIKLLIAGLITLLDDFFTWMEGGESAIGDVWYKIIAILIGVRNTIASIINGILDAIEKISNSALGKLAGLGGIKIDWRMDMVDTQAALEALAKMREENAKKFEESNKPMAEATNANANAAEPYNAALAQGAGTSNYENSNMVNSNNTTTNNVSVSVTVNGANSQDIANTIKDTTENTLRNLESPTA